MKIRKYKWDYGDDSPWYGSFDIVVKIGKNTIYGKGNIDSDGSAVYECNQAVNGWSVNGVPIDTKLYPDLGIPHQCAGETAMRRFEKVRVKELKKIMKELLKKIQKGGKK